jgi:magnesium-transporting ATPase (P-type)
VLSSSFFLFSKRFKLSVFIQRYGPNELAAAPRPSLLQLVLEQFQDRLVQILLCVALFSALTSAFDSGGHSGLAAFVEPLAILAILGLNAGVGVWQGRSAEGALDALQKMQPSLACVLRDGAWQSELPSRELVPGDVVRLRVGDKVTRCARGQLLAATTTHRGARRVRSRLCNDAIACKSVYVGVCSAPLSLFLL